MTVQLYAGEWVEHNAESKVWNAISLAINSVNIIANGLVLVLFLTDRILRHDYRTYLFLNLALADIIWGAAAWVTEALSAHYGAFVTGPVGCQAVLSIASTGMAVSGQTFMWIAVDRYVSICLERPVKRFHIVFVVVLSWVVAFLYTICLFFAGKVSGRGPRLASTRTYCEASWMATHWMMRAVVIFTCMAMVFFATVTAFSYIAVYAKFRKLTHQLNKQTRETVVTAAPVTTQHVPEPKSTIGWHRSKENLTRCGSLGDVTKRINNHRETQAKERLILTKFIVLVVAFLSTFVFWLFSVVVYEAVTGRESPHVLTGMGAVLAYVDSSFNPIFILHQDTRFRAAVSRLWQKISPER